MRHGKDYSMKAAKYGFLLLVTLFTLFFVLLACLDISIALPGRSASPESEHSFQWNSTLNVRQAGNTCGAFSARAVHYLTTGAIEDPYAIYGSFSGKMPNGYVFPWSITRYLSTKSAKYRVFNFWMLSESSQVNWIKQKLSRNKPVIAIVGNTRYLHYITILGYMPDGFLVYDSQILGDLNYESPGNITISASGLTELINSARFKHIPIKLAISER